MKSIVEVMILETIGKSASVMSLYKAGYSYSQVMQWCKELQSEGKIAWDEEGGRYLTPRGKIRLSELKKGTRGYYYELIQPLRQHRFERMNIEDIFLP